MRILLFSRYGQLGASSRIRIHQYLPYLQSYGIEVQVEPLLDDDYIHRLYEGKRPSPLSILTTYTNRAGWLIRNHSFDLLWIEKELFPWLPAWSESLLSNLGVQYIVDYDDAVFHRYDMHSNPYVRKVLGKNIAAVMRHAAVVVVGNDYLAKYAHQSGANRVEYLPSVVDTDRYTIRKNEGGNFNIGWIGSPMTAPYIDLIREALEDVRRKTGARFTLVGVGREDPLPGMEKLIIPWKEENEVQNIQSFDVGIMPLRDAPFERGKCGYKLIQYMACGLPVIASPVGVNSRIVDHGRTGFLALSTQEWSEALITLHNNPGLRKAFGQAGRQKVEQEYSLQVAAPRLLDIIQSVA